MPKIFLCYRREDSKWPAQWTYNDLSNHFGSESVVFDIDTIPLGADFRAYLNEEVSKCDVLLAVIGDQWLKILKQRLDQPNDFVRIEIQAALEREIPVVPILVGEKSVPSEKDLPPELAELSYKRATEVRAGADLQSHLKRLVDGLDRLFPERKVGKELKQKQVDKELKREESPKKYTNSIGMEFVLIPAGSFLMGSHISPEEAVRKYGGEEKWYKPENPQHDVKIREQYYLQTTAVTVGQWRKFIKETGYKTEAETGGGATIWDGSEWNKKKGTYWDKPGFSQDDRHPLTCVSWNDGLELIQWLNRMEGKNKYRLPAEAEWEYACRAGTSTEFSFGDDSGKLSEYAWFIDNSKIRTHPVATKEPNSWGLYDMHGNVWEWLEDDWHEDYNGAPDDGRAWIDKPRGARRVFRGGGWIGDAQYCRSAYRYGSGPDYRSYILGFRLARSVALGP